MPSHRPALSEHPPNRHSISLKIVHQKECSVSLRLQLLQTCLFPSHLEGPDSLCLCYPKKGVFEPCPQSQLIASLREAQAVGNYVRRLQGLVKTPPLIIDDFGLKPLRPPEDEIFHDLVAERYERAATVITSNLDFSEWGDAFLQV